MGEMPEHLKPHAFKPGNPGGPGRPKGTGITDRLRELVMDDNKDAKQLRQCLADAALKAAKNGDHRFWKEIVDRLEGPVTNKTELSGPEGEPLEIRFTVADPKENE